MDAMTTPPPSRRRRRRRRIPLLSGGIGSRKKPRLLLPFLSLLLLPSRSDGQRRRLATATATATNDDPIPLVRQVGLLLPPDDDPPDDPPDDSLPDVVVPPETFEGGFAVVDAPNVPVVGMEEFVLHEMPAPMALPETDPSLPSLSSPQGISSGPQGTLGVGLPPGDRDDIVVPLILTGPKCRTDVKVCPDSGIEVKRDASDSCRFPECPPASIEGGGGGGGGGPQGANGMERDDYYDDLGIGMPHLAPGGSSSTTLSGPQSVSGPMTASGPGGQFATVPPPEPIRIMECYGTCPPLLCPLHHSQVHTDDSCCPHCELDCDDVPCPLLSCGINEDTVFLEGQCCPICERRNTCTDVEGIERPSVTCLFDPCQEDDGITAKTCEGHPEASCRKDECNGCRAVWTVTKRSSVGVTEEIVECSSCEPGGKDCGNGVYVKRDPDNGCEFPLCPDGRPTPTVTGGPMLSSGPMGTQGRDGNVAPDLAPDVVVAPAGGAPNCTLAMCALATCFPGSGPFVPPGGCCPVCPSPPVMCPADAKMCDDGSTSVGRDPRNECKFQPCPGETDGATRIDPGGVPLPVVVIDPGSLPSLLINRELDCKTIECKEPLCSPGTKPHVPDGTCCSVCDPVDDLGEDRRNVLCLEPVCGSGEVPLVPEGEYCPACGVSNCDDVPCPEPVCEEGETPTVDFGKCCPHCRPLHNRCRNPFTGEIDATVRCLVDPCERAECPLHPEATCRPNYCGGCHAVFERNGDVVECERRTFPGCFKDLRVCGDGTTTLVRDPNDDCEFPACPADECDEERKFCGAVPTVCGDGFRPTVPPGECCPSCEREGTLLPPAENKCTTVPCATAPSRCWDNSKPAKPDGECCHVCPPEPTAGDATTPPPPPAKEEPKDCEKKYDCSGCVESGCAWDGGLCFDSCADVVDSYDCYDGNYLNLGTAEEVCDAAETVREDDEMCFRNDDCASCVESIKSDGTNCVWIDSFGGGEDDDGECAAKPLMGRGADVCEAKPEAPRAPELPMEHVAIEPIAASFDKERDCWQRNLSCSECLSKGCGGWYGSCLPDCSRIADAKCWSLGMSERAGDSFVTYGTVDAVCGLFETDKADGKLCGAVEGGCDACVSTIRSDGVKKCKWVSPAWGGDGFCALEGGMMGPASDTCPVEPAVRPPVPATAGPDLAPEPLACLADVATCSDGRVVGRDPALGCRFPCEAAVPEVPITAGPDLAPDDTCKDVACPYVEPVCKHGKHYVPEGECCRVCPPVKHHGDDDEKCDPSLCPKLKCPGGDFESVVPEGECCPLCVPKEEKSPEEAPARCADAACPEIALRCDYGQKPAIPEGSCCRACPPVACEEDYRTCEDGTVLKRDPSNECVMPECPKPNRAKPLVPDDDDEKCPKPVVACQGNPCRRAYCAAYGPDEVECVPSYCGVCGAVFVDRDGNEVDCASQSFGPDEDEPDNLRDKAKKYDKAPKKDAGTRKKAGGKKAGGRKAGGRKAGGRKANIKANIRGGGGVAKKAGRRKFNGD